MSVLACDRRYCSNVMCDHLICGQYVCYDCLKEFKDPFGNRRLEFEDFENAFNEFMNTTKGDDEYEVEDGITVNDFIDEYRREDKEYYW